MSTSPSPGQMEDAGPGRSPLPHQYYVSHGAFRDPLGGKWGDGGGRDRCTVAFDLMGEKMKELRVD